MFTLETESLCPWSLDLTSFLISLILFGDNLLCFLVIELEDIPEHDDNELESSEREELLFDDTLWETLSLIDLEDFCKILLSTKFTKDDDRDPRRFPAKPLGTSALTISLKS